MIRLTGAGLMLVVVMASASPAFAQDARELAAREAFAKGEYQDALDAYVKLYAETQHPTYLRNIGRCYQNLGEPDKAIASFRDYLRRVPDLPPDKRAEIDRYIAEMEGLKRQRAAGPPKEGPPLAPILAPVTPPASVAPAGVVMQPPPEPARPLYGRWWFWAGVAAVAIAGVAIAVAASSGSGPPTGSAGNWDTRKM